MGLSDCWGSTSAAVDRLFTKSSKTGFMERDLGGLRVLRVTEPDSPLYTKVVDVIARGEAGTAKTAPDPLLDWVYTERKEGICDPLPEEPSVHRLAWFRFLAAFMVDFGIKRGGTYALVDPESREVVAATVTAPPQTVHNLVYTCHQTDIRKIGMEMAAQVLTHPRMSVLGKWQHHVQEKLGLGSNFLEVMIFATAPEVQGRGYGSHLLRFLGDVADADAVPSLLETAGTRNTTFYAEKGGYEQYCHQAVATFTHEGGGVGMLRRAQQSNCNSGFRV